MDWIEAYSYFRMATPVGWTITTMEGHGGYSVEFVARRDIAYVKLAVTAEVLWRGRATIKHMAARFGREVRQRDAYRLKNMPTTGRVLIGHPDHEDRLVRTAKARGLDYVLSTLCPAGQMYEANLDALYAPLGPWVR